MILNAGDAYQTVTIVPSDTNPGEVSYVLIVQQPDDKDDKGDDQDLTVYDFDEGEEGGIALVSIATRVYSTVDTHGRASTLVYQ
jgi:hypothetical protein